MGLVLEARWKEKSAQMPAQESHRQQLVRPGRQAVEEEVEVIWHQTVDRAAAGMPERDMQQSLSKDPVKLGCEPSGGPVVEGERPENRGRCPVPTRVEAREMAWSLGGIRKGFHGTRTPHSPAIPKEASDARLAFPRLLVDAVVKPQSPGALSPARLRREIHGTTAAQTISSTRRMPSSPPLLPSWNGVRASGFQSSRAFEGSGWGMRVKVGSYWPLFPPIL